MSNFIYPSIPANLQTILDGYATVVEVDAYVAAATLSPNDLLYNIAQTCTKVITRSGGLITNVLFQTIGGSPVPIRNIAVTRTSGLITGLIITQYNSIGSATETMTGTVVRTAGLLASVNWVRA